MVRLLKYSTAKTLRMGPFVDATDGYSAETGLTIARANIQLSKSGGAFGQTSATSPTTTHDRDGWYQIPLTSTDTGTLGPLTVQIVVSGARPVWEHFIVVPAKIYNYVVEGSGYLQVADSSGVTSLMARIPNAAPGAEGGLPLLDANLCIAADLQRVAGELAGNALVRFGNNSVIYVVSGA